MEYQVTIEERLVRTVAVEAQYPEDARNQAMQMYFSEEIVLTADDFNGVEFIVAD